MQRGLGHIELETEFVFHPSRDWRFDFAFPAFKVAVEIDGRGRHQTIDGVRRDLEKHRAAVLRGWQLMRYPATDREQALDWAREVRELLAQIEPAVDACAVCGCTEGSPCIAAAGEACAWARAAVCSFCAARMPAARARR